MRRDKGVKRGPATSAFVHLTGETNPSDAEATEPAEAAVEIEVSRVRVGEGRHIVRRLVCVLVLESAAYI